MLHQHAVSFFSLSGAYALRLVCADYRTLVDGAPWTVTPEDAARLRAHFAGGRRPHCQRLGAEADAALCLPACLLFRHSFAFRAERDVARRLGAATSGHGRVYWNMALPPAALAGLVAALPRWQVVANAAPPPELPLCDLCLVDLALTREHVAVLRKMGTLCRLQLSRCTVSAELLRELVEGWAIVLNVDDVTIAGTARDRIDVLYSLLKRNPELSLVGRDVTPTHYWGLRWADTGVGAMVERGVSAWDVLGF